MSSTIKSRTIFEQTTVINLTAKEIDSMLKNNTRIYVPVNVTSITAYNEKTNCAVIIKNIDEK